MKDVVVVLGLAVACSSLSCSTSSNVLKQREPQSLQAALADFGYTLLRPPSTLVPPGTVLQVLTRNPYRTQIVCTAKAALGDSVDLPSSSTSNVELSKKLKDDLSIDADYLAMLKANSQYSSVQDIHLRLSGVTLTELSYDQVYEHVQSRSSSCQRAIEDLFANGNEMSMVTSVLRADVLYTVDFDASMNANATTRAALLKQLGTDLGLTSSNTGASTISGTALYWGIRDDARLAYLKPDRSSLIAQRDTGVFADTTGIRVIPKGAVAIIAPQ